MRRSLLWILAVMLLAALPAGASALVRENPQAASQRALRYGDRGVVVAALQKQLLAAGFDPGPVDGIFGPLTRAAVAQAQIRLGLEVDGLAGGLTVAALQQKTAPATAAARAAQQPAPAAESPSGPAPRLFALTFNGDPDPVLLPRLLDLLKQQGMQATFFLRGETAERAPGTVAQIAAAGHEIASNGYAEVDMTRITEEMRKAQLRHAQRAIAEVVGAEPAYFRPPLGRFNDAVASTAGSMNLSLVLWTNVGVRDQGEVEPDELAEGLAASVYPGAVLMLHQDRATAVGALESLLPALRRDGYQSVGLSRLVPKGDRQ